MSEIYKITQTVWDGSPPDRILARRGERCKMVMVHPLTHDVLIITKKGIRFWINPKFLEPISQFKGKEKQSVSAVHAELSRG